MCRSARATCISRATVWNPCAIWSCIRSTRERRAERLVFRSDPSAALLACGPGLRVGRADSTFSGGKDVFALAPLDSRLFDDERHAAAQQGSISQRCLATGHPAHVAVEREGKARRGGSAISCSPSTSWAQSMRRCSPIGDSSRRKTCTRYSRQRRRRRSCRRRGWRR